MRYAARAGGRVPHTMYHRPAARRGPSRAPQTGAAQPRSHGVPFAQLSGRGQHQRPAGRRHDRQRADGRHESATRERNARFPSAGRDPDLPGPIPKIWSNSWRITRSWLSVILRRMRISLPGSQAYSWWYGLSSLSCRHVSSPLRSRHRIKSGFLQPRLI